MSCVNLPGRLVGSCALLGILLAASAAGSIGKSEKPRPDDSPMALGEPTSQGEVAKPDGRKTAAAVDVRRPEGEARRSTPAELLAAEERKHLRRIARTNRIQALGIESAVQGLVDLARELRHKETRRHELAMTRLERALTTGGER